MTIIPCDLDDANEFVRRWHRHHEPVPGHKFSIAVCDDFDHVVGVAIVLRLRARLSNDGWTLEVVRCATDGTRNACSMLYRSAWRAVSAQGYRRLITYTLPEEGGASLRGAGFKCLGLRGGGTWSRADRPRVDKHPLQSKILWEVA